MNFLRKKKLILVTGAVLTAFACVTINIYFPAEKVESVAGKIVDEIRGPDSGGSEKTPGKDQKSMLHQIRLALLPSVAWAEEVTTVENATIRALKARMKERFAQTKPFYQKGVLKEGDDGYVSLAAAGLGLKEKRDLTALVEAENRDRLTLYQEVAGALKIDPSQVSRVAQVFAKEWQKSLQ